MRNLGSEKQGSEHKFNFLGIRRILIVHSKDLQVLNFLAKEYTLKESIEGPKTATICALFLAALSRSF